MLLNTGWDQPGRKKEKLTKGLPHEARHEGSRGQCTLEGKPMRENEGSVIRASPCKRPIGNVGGREQDGRKC